MEASTETQSSWSRARRFLGAAALVAYGVVLWIWFRDPGRPDGTGFLVRSGTLWPGALVFAVLLALWVRYRWARLSRLGRELRSWLMIGTVDAVILTGILLVAAAYQSSLFLHAGGVIDSDSVLPGIIAKHIVDGRPAPAFIYELLYGGTFSAHLLAIVYKAAGPSVVGLLAVTRFFFLLFIAAEYLLLRASFGRGVAVAACLWLAVPPHFFLTQLTYTEFPEILALGTVGMLLVALRVGERVTDDGIYSLAGLLFGIGFWTQPLITPIVLASAIGVGLLRGLAHLLAATKRAVLGFAIGVLPALVGWGTDAVRFAAWLVASEAEGDGSVSLIETAAQVTRQGFPVLFGRYATIELGVLAATALATAIVGPALWGVRRGLRSHREARNDETSLAAPTALLLGLVVLVHLAVFLWSPFSMVIPPRYLLPLYVGVPALIALAVRDLTAWLTRRKALANGAAVLAMVAWMAIGVPASNAWMRDVGQRHDELRASVEELNGRGVKFCEGPYWDAYWLTFFTLEEIICAPSDVIRDPYYRAALEQNVTGRFPVFLARHGSGWLQFPIDAARSQNYPHELWETPTFQVLRIDVE